MKGWISNILAWPLTFVMWILDGFFTHLMHIYAESVVVSGWMSRTINRVFCTLVTMTVPLVWIKTCFIPFQSHRPIPPPSNTLLNLSAKSLAHRIRHRKLKCEDVVSAYIQRIKEVNPILNCVVEERFKDALKEARVVDELLTARPNTDYWKTNKPLLGVPLTVKESIAVKGMSNNAARTHVKENVAREDAEGVYLLKRAGAIVLLVSATPEMCMNWETFSEDLGTTRNPYDTRRTCGGSSGGEGALLGAGASVIGLGSDLAGSLRIPACFNGVFAHKPTPGFVPYTGHIPYAVDEGIFSGTWESVFSLGPMTRYSEDLPLMLSNLIPERNQPQKLALDQPVEFKSLRIYYVDELHSGWIMHNEIGQDMRSALFKLIRYLKIAFNLSVQKINLKECEDLMPLSAVIMTQIKVVDSIFQKKNADPDDWENVPKVIMKSLASERPASPLVLALAPLTYLFRKVPEKTYKKIISRRDRIRQQIEDCLGNDGILLVPTFPNVAPFHRRISYQFLNSSYTILFNILGLPVTQCPLGLTKDGLPIGIQVVASREQDRLCLAAAQVLESAFGGWTPPPRSNNDSNSRLYPNGK